MDIHTHMRINVYYIAYTCIHIKNLFLKTYSSSILLSPISSLRFSAYILFLEPVFPMSKFIVKESGEYISYLCFQRICFWLGARKKSGRRSLCQNLQQIWGKGIHLSFFAPSTLSVPYVYFCKNLFFGARIFFNFY